MGDNGKLAPALPRPKVQWLKGHLREEVKASECVHLHPDIEIPVMHVAQPVAEGKIAVPGQSGQVAARMVRMISGTVRNHLMCSSPRLLAGWRAALEQQAPDLAEQFSRIQGIETELEFCRLCPFWERAQ